MRLDKDQIKNSLTEQDIKSILEDLDSNYPNKSKDNLIFQTVCHNHVGGSHKLYYYSDSKIFNCYTNCGSMDVYELVMKAKSEQGYTFSFYDSIKYVAEITGKNLYTNEHSTQKPSDTSDDWEWLDSLGKKKRKNLELS